MKTTKICLLITTILYFVISCTKDYYENSEKLQQLEIVTEINRIIDAPYAEFEQNEITIYNPANPYDIAGIEVYNSILKAYRKIKKTKNDPSLIKDEFIINLSESIPYDLEYLDTTNINSLEKTIQDKILNLFIEKEIEEYIFKSKQIENIILKSNYVEDNQKKRMLVYSSVLRHLPGAISEIYLEEQIKGGWEDCFEAKLLELAECKNCYLEKIACIFMWPECLGLKAIDCLIDAIITK